MKEDALKRSLSFSLFVSSLGDNDPDDYGEMQINPAIIHTWIFTHKRDYNGIEVQSKYSSNLESDWLFKLTVRFIHLYLVAGLNAITTTVFDSYCT